MSEQEKLAKFIREIITLLLIGYAFGMLMVMGFILWVVLT